MRKLVNILCSASLVAMQLAVAMPVTAAPDNRSMPQARSAPGGRGNAGGASAGRANRGQANPGRGSGGGYAKPAYSKPAVQARPTPASNFGGNNYRPDLNRPGNNSRPGNDNRPDLNRPGNNNRPGNDNRPDLNRPGNDNRPGSNNRPGNDNRPGNNNRPGGGNTININNNNVNINRYPPYRPPGGGYYRPPNGGYYGPPRPPYGGWHGGYYPPPRYYYNDGPSIGGVLFGVAVTTSLLALLSAASQPTVVYVQGQTPPPLPAYVPPSNTSGAPALINVDLNAMSSDARPSASVCVTEAARQIGATGGSEIRIGQTIEVEKGNGGYRFRLTLIGVYPDATREIPMYCRATSDKIIELTFG